MKKLIVIGSVILVVGLGVGVYYLASNLNSLVASAIEKNGSEVTETAVRVSGVEISLREGRGSIRGLRVASPEGFEARDAFSLGDITIDLDVGSVREDPIVIEELRIRAPEIHAEVSEKGVSNIDELRKRVQAYSPPGSEGGQGDGRNIRIKKFVLEEAKLEVDATALGIEKRTLTLPAIRMNDVGGAKGASPETVTKLILTRVAKETASEIAGSEVQRLVEKELGESVSEKAKGLLDKISN